MDYTHKRRLVSPSYPTFQDYHDTGGYQLERSPRKEPYYTREREQSHYTHPDRRERFAEQQPASPRRRPVLEYLDSEDRDPHYHHQRRRDSLVTHPRWDDSRLDRRDNDTLSTRGRGKVGKGRDRAKKKRQQQKVKQQKQNQQQHRDDSPIAASNTTHPYDPRQQATASGADKSTVNAIQISNARNRLRDRFGPLLSDTVPELIPDSDTKREIRATSIESSRSVRQQEPQPVPAAADPELFQHPKLPPPSATIQHQYMSTSTNGAPATPTGPAGSLHAGPTRTRRLPNHLQVADAYIFQQNIDERLKRIGVTPAREDALRLAGVQWIDQVRRALKLPVRTFDTACVYYHKFRLMHGDNEYAYVDAAAAALFAACKIEDTLKKSRDILCAAHNLLKAPSRSEHLSPDDPSFEASARTIVGHERLMLESAGFDFRSRCPQVLLVKLLKEANTEDAARETAWKISLDLYRTMAPLKQSTPALAFACIELAERLSDSWDENLNAGDQERTERKYVRWGVRRDMVVETLLDLLDVYTSHRTSTALGPSFPLDKFLQVRIPLNDESARRRLPRYTEYIEPPQPTQSGNSGEGVGGYGARHLPNGTAAGVNGGGSGRSSKNTSPKDFLSSPASGGPTVTPGTGGSAASTAATGAAGLIAGANAAGGNAAQIRQRASERGRDGTIRFMLNPEREREERAIVGEYERFGGGGGGPGGPGGPGGR